MTIELDVKPSLFILHFSIGNLLEVFFPDQLDRNSFRFSILSIQTLTYNGPSVAMCVSVQLCMRGVNV